MWKAVAGGRALRFRLIGINNQNFVMEDEETGSWWQQITGAAWLAQQNPFEWMFNPVRAAEYASLDEASAFVADDDMVLAVECDGDAVGYPVRLLAYHHLVEDTVGGRAIVATY